MNLKTINFMNKQENKVKIASIAKLLMNTLTTTKGCFFPEVWNSYETLALT